MNTYPNTVPCSSEINRQGKDFRKSLYYLLAFILAGCTLFGEILPFGVALYAAEYLATPPYFLGVVVIFAAILPSFLPLSAIKYTIALVLFSLLCAKHGTAITKTPLRRGLTMGASVFSAGLFLLLGGQLLIYDCFILILEAGIVCGAVCLFAKARQVFSFGKSLTSPLDVFSVAALFGVAVLGLSGLFSPLGMPITLPFCALGVLLLAHNSGMAQGATAGITLGFLATLETGEPVLGAFAVAGLACGYFSAYGRLPAVLAFLLSHAVVTFYTGGSADILLSLSSMGAPILLYLALPRGLMRRLSACGNGEWGQEGHAREALFSALREKADAFSYLSCAFSEISDHKKMDAQASFFEKTARHACEGCPKLSFCWKREFHRTYAAFFVMLEICKKNGGVERGDIPVSLEEKCIRPSLLLEAFSRMYQVYRVDTLWESRMHEARTLIARQLSAVSHVLLEIEKTTRYAYGENEALKSMIHTRLMQEEIPVQSLSVTMKKQGDFSVFLATDPSISEETLIQAVSGALSMPMEILLSQNGSFKLCPTRRVHLDIRGATLPRDGSEKSGDSFDSMYLENGAYLLAISDGMGSGKRASADSRAAVKMLFSLFGAGFDKETAVGLVNSALVLKSAEEAFATLDLMVLDTQSMEAEFIKAGAAASFIKRGDKVKTYAAGTLPAGVVPSPDTAVLKTDIRPGDMVIMLSDGLLEPVRNDGTYTWVEEAIRSYDGGDPHALSRLLLSLAKEKCGGKVQDDMTVLCAAVLENKQIVA